MAKRPRQIPLIPPPPESAVLSDILRALGLFCRDVLYWRCNTGQLESEEGQAVRFGLGKGTPDILGCLGPAGRWIGLEVKRPGEKPTPAQVAWGQRLQARGGFWAVVTSVEEALDAVARARRGELG